MSRQLKKQPYIPTCPNPIMRFLNHAPYRVLYSYPQNPHDFYINKGGMSRIEKSIDTYPLNF